MSNNSSSKFRKFLTSPATLSKSLLVLIVLVTFMTGVYTERFMGVIFLNNCNGDGTTIIPDNNDGDSTGDTNVTYPISFRIDSFKSGYDKVNGQCFIRFVVNVTETGGIAATCHLLLSVNDKNAQVYSSDQYIDFLPHQSKGEVFTWPVATEIWDQDLIVWSTASVKVVS
ncbi:MAG: hypothetical protein ACFFD4_08240 [Candidatus Odinarchaeota archaeon]